MSTYHFINQTKGIRLDKFLAGQYPDLSRSQIQKLIIDNYATINNITARAGIKLEIGDKISLTLPASAVPSTESIPLNVIYEDSNIVVIDKPAGLVVHPAPGHPDRTLFNVIISRYPELAQKDSLRSGIVHRLDKDTSGLMVIAKNDMALEYLQSQFKNRTVTRKYLVLVHGHVKSREGEITASIGRDPLLRQRMAIVSDGKDASTLFHVVQYLDSYTLLELTLVTGRTHQIRIHLAAIGYPVAGDGTYGKSAIFLKRQFVHAHILGFNLPGSGERKEFKSELPDDLKQALEQIAIS